MFKSDQEVSKNVHNLKFLTSYLEDKDIIVLIFNKVEYVCIKKDKLVGDVNKLKAYIEKAMSKANVK